MSHAVEPTSLAPGPAVASVAEDRAVARGRAARLRQQSLDLQTDARAAIDHARLLEVEIAQLKAGLATRGRIENVVGMFMLLLSCDQDQAFGCLRYLSSVTNRKVRDLAETIAAQVARGEGVPPDVAAVLKDVLGTTTTSGRRSKG